MKALFYQRAGDHRMRALIWKDYRANRLVLIVGAFLLFAPHIFAVILVWRGDIASAPTRLGTREFGALEFVLFVASLYSLAFSCLTLALLGGNLIACERADGSAEFLAGLPPSRVKILASKAILALATVLVSWGYNLVFICSVWPGVPTSPRSDFQMASVLVGIGVTGFVMFGVGWLASSFLSSPTFAITAALPTPLAIAALLSGCYFYLGWPTSDTTGDWYMVFCLVLGTLCLIGGTCYYLRRIEP